MGEWSREELEEEFGKYQEVAAEAAMSGDWRAWADQFTEDATYIEHHFGEFSGNEAIYQWIQATMSEFPNNEMTSFPVDWYTVDEDKGWIIFKVWNRFKDLGDGKVYQAYNLSILHYAGNGKWSYEEDVYNPVLFAPTVGDYLKAKKALGVS
jgi:hypothetical protein